MIYLSSLPLINTLSPISSTILMGTIFFSPNPILAEIPASSS